MAHLDAQHAQESIAPGRSEAMSWLLLSPIIVCSVIVLVVHRQRTITFLKHAGVIGLASGVARMWFARENGDPNASLVFLEYGSLAWLTALAGLSLAAHLQIPSFVVKQSILKQSVYTALFALAVVALNSMMLLQTAKAGALPQWLRSISSISHLSAVALQAGLVEETIFRLFLLPLVIWILVLLGWKTQRPHVRQLLAVLVAAIFFGLMHGQGFAGAFIFGIAFGYFFLHFGWLPCVVVHVLGDFIPFLIVLPLNET